METKPKKNFGSTPDTTHHISWMVLYCEPQPLPRIILSCGGWYHPTGGQDLHQHLLHLVILSTGLLLQKLLQPPLGRIFTSIYENRDESRREGIETNREELIPGPGRRLCWEEQHRDKGTLLANDTNPISTNGARRSLRCCAKSVDRTWDESSGWGQRELSHVQRMPTGQVLVS
jgi:hypothetical protein